MSLTIHPGAAHGTTTAPPSKSYTHRALFLAALASGKCHITDALLSEDPKATLRCVRDFGAQVDATDPERITISSDGILRTPENVVDCLNSGTTLRLATALAALTPGTSVLTGDASLRKRPMKPLLDALTALGVRAESTRDNGCAPVLVRGPLRGGTTRLPGDVSSQFVSALLLAGTRTRDGVTVELTSPLKSRPYVDITLEMVRDFAGRIEETPTGFHAPGGQALHAASYRVPGDYSTAAFPLAAGALAGEVTVENLPEHSAQGDKVILDLLERFGARVTRRGRSATVASAPLHGIEADLSDTPDAFPILCAVAAHAQGTTTLSGAAHLRYKESDRIHAMVTNLRKLGVDAQERPDGAVIHGGPVRGGAGLETEGDHRIEMALAVCALAAQGPVTLDTHDAHAVSYPEFIPDFARLGARLEVHA